VATPKCPGCGAKFAHSKAMQACSKCGLPDEIARMGAQMIARWKRKELRGRVVTKAAAKDLNVKHPSTRNRKRKAHGRA
jgi:hypothetical protein